MGTYAAIRSALETVYKMKSVYVTLSSGSVESVPLRLALPCRGASAA